MLQKTAHRCRKLPFHRSASCSAHTSRTSSFKASPSIIPPHSIVLGTRQRHISTVQGRSAHSGTHKDIRSDLLLSDAQRRTIYALSTPPGKAGVAIIRISGPNALDVWRKVVELPSTSKGKTRASNPEPWKMHRCHVVHPESGDILDDGLAVFFKGPKSFTTEDVLELHVHSGHAIISSVLHALSTLSYCRMAEPGEFTRRAFNAGRLDLTQVEGLKDLIDAETESQRRVALRATEGHLKLWLEQIRTDIIGCLGLVEALIDFSEEDVEEGVYKQARERVQHVRQKIESQLSDFRRGEILRSGVKLVIFGPPNAGKSSLFNVLAQREAAIVTNVPGTTRDVLEISLDLGGLPVLVADTAGLRVTDDVVEKIGIQRATDKVAVADISLCILSLPEVLTHANLSSRPQANISVPETIMSMISAENTFLLLNKSDLLPSLTSKELDAIERCLNIQKAWAVSLTTGEGIKQFLDGFAQALQHRYGLLQHQGSHTSEPLITHSRHRTHLESALRFLEAFLTTDQEDVVLGAEELRYAARAIGQISGRIDVEDVLDVVFRDFCIGK